MGGVVTVELLLLPCRARHLKYAFMNARPLSSAFDQAMKRIEGSGS
jgi:hypothetical protein